MHELLLFMIGLKDLLPFSILGGLFLLVLGLVLIFAIIKRLDLRDRATLEPICTWEYSAPEWPQIAEKYELSDRSKGSASVRITKLDIWITDGNGRKRHELDADRCCVTACIYDGGLFKVRTRSWAKTTRSGITQYFKVDLRLPVPAGHEPAAQKAAEYFSENIGKQSYKIASVLPDDVPVGIFDETGL